ncbi:CobW family GTP-binding protein [Nocardiopsis sp. NPDC058631]|uniref:CobW family GTP-binding protein n=1 Tax=Nocardiopsis sp. NPDC058631 TaxID=3346566 RepID=UPI0036483AE7
MRVAVVSGLHRNARGRTVEDLLAAEPGAVAVHHDLGGINEGIVHRLVHDRRGTIDHDRVHLGHPCVSCVVREDLVPTLLELAERGGQGLCVVEVWEGVEPRRVCEAVAARAELRLCAVVTAVDAERLLPDLSGHDDVRDRGLDVSAEDERAVAELLAHQIEYPTVLALHGSRHLDEARALLEQLNPAAVVLAPDVCPADLTRGRFDPETAAHRLNPAWAQYAERQDGRVGTVTWTRKRPLHPERLHGALERIVASGLRGRGRIWLADRPDTLLVWDAYNDALLLESAGPWLGALPEAAAELVPQIRRTSALLDWDPVVCDRRQHLAFTGVDLDAARLVSLLDSCLLTEEEAGRPLGSDPFADAL